MYIKKSDLFFLVSFGEPLVQGIPTLVYFFASKI